MILTGVLNNGFTSVSTGVSAVISTDYFVGVFTGFLMVN